jgi:hypothetical protein
MFATLDAVKVANTVIFVTSATKEKEIIDDWGREVIVSCCAQGLPTSIVAVHNIQKLHIKVNIIAYKRYLNSLKRNACYYSLYIF